MRFIYAKIKPGTKKSLKGYILDIGRSGIGIASSGDVPKNSLVEIAVKQIGCLKLKGKVMSSIQRAHSDYPYRLGIMFSRINQKDREKLNFFLRRQNKRRKPRLSFIYTF